MGVGRSVPMHGSGDSDAPVVVGGGGGGCGEGFDAAAASERGASGAAEKTDRQVAAPWPSRVAAAAAAALFILSFTFRGGWLAPEDPFLVPETAPFWDNFNQTEVANWVAPKAAIGPFIECRVAAPGAARDCRAVGMRKCDQRTWQGGVCRNKPFSRHCKHQCACTNVSMIFTALACTVTCMMLPCCLADPTKPSRAPARFAVVVTLIFGFIGMMVFMVPVAQHTTPNSNSMHPPSVFIKGMRAEGGFFLFLSGMGMLLAAMPLIGKPPPREPRELGGRKRLNQELALRVEEGRRGPGGGGQGLRQLTVNPMQQAAASAGDVGAMFCGYCGKKAGAATMKFCQGCGKPYE